MSKRILHFKPRRCIECGKEFMPRCGTQKVCDGPHTTPCEYCGKLITYSCHPSEKPRFCSAECRELHKKKYLMEKYGVDNVSKLDSVKKKISERNKSEEVRLKREKTCLDRYGATNPSKSPEIKEKLSRIMKTDEYLRGREQTCLEKYGYTTPMLNPDILKKRRDTCMIKYGTPGPAYTTERYSKIMTDGSKVNEYLEFKEDPKKYIESHFESKPTIYDLEHCLGVTNSPIYDILLQYDCTELVKRSTSKIEYEVYTFLKSIYSGEIIQHCRREIPHYELDFYIPEFKLGIECNPASTHNSSIAWLGDNVTHYRYHQIKTDLCKERGIFLFHIFGYEWNLKNDIIKSMLQNLLHCNSQCLGARKTYVCNVSYNECKEFLNKNHRQGYTTSKVRLGLRNKSNNELVSVMTFGHMRNTMGKTSKSSESDWELSRFCTKLFTNVSGSASKLLKYFIDTYHPSTITSFSDDSHTKGTLYQSLGFQYVDRTSPNYFYTDMYDTKFLNRVSCQKQYLRKLFNDDSIDLTQTEREIMESHGFVRTYDSGVCKWILKCN